MPLKSWFCKNGRTKLLYAGGACLAILLYIIILVITVTNSGKKSKSHSEVTYIFGGRSNLPSSLYQHIHNNLSSFNFGENLTDYYEEIGCIGCTTDLWKLREAKINSLMMYTQLNHTREHLKSLYETSLQIDFVKSLIKRNNNDMALVKSCAELSQAERTKKIGIILGIDGGTAFVSNLGILRMYHDLGVKVISLSTGLGTPWISGYMDGSKNEISLHPLAKEIIKEMNREGVLLDLSGLSHTSMNEVLNISRAPVMFSHSAAYGLFEHPANIPDDTLDLLKVNGGLIMVTFDSIYLSNDSHNVTLSTLTDHINYIVDRIGYDNIALGGNFDNDSRKPIGAEDITSYSTFFGLLVSTNHTWSENQNLEKLAGLNFKRVFCEAEKVGYHLRK